ncbi:MAG: hypothetical protein M3451_13115 [Chloroflexota bacterium]|nr:hypothetical protein [Chloroflexota bacterium]
MDLFRAHAFTVPPGRLGGDRPVGAALEITEQLRSALGDALADVPVERQIAVGFRIDLEQSDPAGDGHRANEVRDLLLRFSFGDAAEAAEAGTTLAERLCDATDQRSNRCLMVISAAREGDQRQISIWTFPQEAAFRFEPTRSLIQLLEDVFSQRSDLRKAASFEGTPRRDGFMTGWVVDLQASAGAGTVADYWIHRFLDCEVNVTPTSGTRLLARALRDAAEHVDSPDARAQLFSTAAHLPHQPHPAGQPPGQGTARVADPKARGAPGTRDRSIIKAGAMLSWILSAVERRRSRRRSLAAGGWESTSRIYRSP